MVAKPAARPRRPLLPPAVEVRADVVFARYGARELALHLFRPHRGVSAAALPAIVYVHGGGWKLGDKDCAFRLGLRTAARGYAVAAVSYRLSGEAPFPAQIQDVTCAVRFLRANAGTLRIDPGRIGAWGHSAGGHLVSLLGVAGAHPALAGDGGWPGVDSRVQAVCNCCGVSDVALWARHTMPGEPLQPEHYAGLFLGGPTAARVGLARLASPLTHVTAAAPPFLTLHGQADQIVPVEQGRLLHRALLAAGARSELHELPEAGHGFAGPQIDARIDAFFDRELKTVRR